MSELNSDHCLPRLHGLFATPVMHLPRFVPPENCAGITQLIEHVPSLQNSHNTDLSHSAFLSADVFETCRTLMPGLNNAVAGFGEQLFGEALDWTIKEAWFNRLKSGGQQTEHLHANSFASGVVYLTDSHPSANLVFHKPGGGSEYVFSNFHAASDVTAYNAARWQLPEISAGDLVLFPSYLKHSVPRNQGDTRVSLAFNAIPDRLNSWGYKVSLSRG